MENTFLKCFVFIIVFLGQFNMTNGDSKFIEKFIFFNYHLDLLDLFSYLFMFIFVFLFDFLPPLYNIVERGVKHHKPSNFPCMYNLGKWY